MTNGKIIFIIYISHVIFKYVLKIENKWANNSIRKLARKYKRMANRKKKCK